MSVITDLDRWIEQQYPIAVRNMQLAISATATVKERPGFGQTITPKRGSVVASPVPASYDPDPDYFFHWYRDSAVVIDALRQIDPRWLDDDMAAAHFCDFVDFSLSLNALRGADLVAEPGWRVKVAEDYRQFVREDADLASAVVRGETRVNPDGSLDISRWNRPQYDGIAARVLTVLRWASGRSFGVRHDDAVATLLDQDIRFVLAHWREPSYDIWEEEKAHHYYTLRIEAAALEEGASWLAAQGDAATAQRARADAAEIQGRLHHFWQPEEEFYRSRLTEDGKPTPKDLDIAVILAAIHAAGALPTHSPHDIRMEATLDRLDEIFKEDYAINRGRPEGRGIALGRYRGDEYYSGGAYYFSTQAGAEFCYLRAAALRAADPAAADRLKARGDAYLETIRAFTPDDGEMSEQFDQATGEHTSAKHLAWSYAGFITAVEARRKAG
ncbi:glycoside hydrolase family 15 protein [Labrys sp. (in: a-proteobacteria)]|uniref:glycoside hydrolase family 15 protein n=1 Tax=Labrys sp. (in: a-proteobacteria) TaxID=1917972 RepID=UPI0039E67FD4